MRKTFKNEIGITLIALVVTIIVLLILAGITLTLVMGENGLIAKASLAGKNMTEAQNSENGQLSNLDNTMGEYIAGTSREDATFNKEQVKAIVQEVLAEKKQQAKTILYEGTDKTIDLTSKGYNLTDYDLVIVYYKTVNTSGTLTFETSKTDEYQTNYTYSTRYCFSFIKMNLEENKITTTVSGNDPSGWNLEPYIKKIVGIKL